MTECFGERLRALRLATAAPAPPRPHLIGTRWATDGHLSSTGLARLAKVDPSHVWLLEHGRHQPSRAVAERLAAALACSDVERARLLVSAGYWPWPDADTDTTELLVALGLAVLDGDYRPLEQSVIDASRAMHQNG